MCRDVSALAVRVVWCRHSELSTNLTGCVLGECLCYWVHTGPLPDALSFCTPSWLAIVLDCLLLICSIKLLENCWLSWWVFWERKESWCTVRHHIHAHNEREGGRVECVHTHTYFHSWAQLILHLKSSLLNITVHIYMNKCTVCTQWPCFTYLDDK